LTLEGLPEEKAMKRFSIVSMALAVAVLSVSPGWAANRATSSSAETAEATKDSPAAGKGSRLRVRLGGISVGAGYSHFSGYSPYGYPYLYRPYWGAFGDPFWNYGWGGWLHPGYYGGFRQGPGMGLVKVKAPSKQAEVYVDGAYAGLAKDLGSMWLEPGAYDLEVREDSDIFHKRIYVLSGKTVRINAGLAPKEEKQP
jgi:hypothetical protein